MNKYKGILVIFSLIFGSAVYAQSGVYEDLVVTATKKETSLMDTPAAIAALPGDQLNTRGIDNIDGLNRITPDLLSAGEGHSRTNIRIRGIGTYDFSLAADPSTVIVIDGVAQPRVSGASHGFRDLERVEILKGPQGALYGTNALAGIVNIVTKKPMGGDSGYFSVAAGDNDDADINLSLETDLSDSTSARISLARGYDAGVSFEELTGQDDGVEYTFGRMALYGTYDNGVEWSSAFSHSRDQQDAVINEQDFLCNTTNPAAELLILAAVPAAGTKFCTSTNSSLASADIMTRGVVDTSNAIVKASLASKHSQPMSTAGYNFSELMNFSYTAKMNLDNDMSVTGLLGWNKINSGELRDFDGTTAPGLDQGHAAKSDTYSIELRLDSDPTIKMPWSVGLYGMRDHGTREDHFTSYAFGVPNFISFGAGAMAYIRGNNGAPVVVNGTPVLTSDAASGAITMASAAAPPNQALIGAWLQACVDNNSQCQAYGTPAVARPAVTGRQYIDQYDVDNFKGAMTVPGVNRARVGLKTQATAINGNITIPISDNMSLLVAGRYSVHDKPYTYSGRTNKVGQALLVVENFDINHGTTEKEFDPKVTLEMTNGDALSWLTYATGYKSGGIGFAKWSPTTAKDTYAPEKLEMIEAGYKTTLDNGSAQLEVIGYNYDYTDHQQLLVCSTPQGPAGCVVNGDATIQGLSATYRTFLSDNTNLGFTYAYTDATWDKFMDTACCGTTNPYDRSGQQMPFSAENNLLVNLDHVQNTQMGEINYNLNVSYKDEYSVQLDRWDGVTMVDDLTLVNANVSLMTNAGIEVSAFCTNCLDEEYLRVSLVGVRSQGGGARTGYGEMRRIGIRLSSDF